MHCASKLYFWHVYYSGKLTSAPGVLNALVQLVGQGVVLDLFNQLGTEPPDLEAFMPKSLNLSLDGTEIADAEARKRFWTSVMNDPTQSPADRLRASDLLGKSEGDFKGYDVATSEFDLAAMLERIESREEATRSKEEDQAADLVRVGALPPGINLDSLSGQLHNEWFDREGDIKTDRPRRKIIIETVPAEQPAADEAGSPNGTDNQPRPSLRHHFEKSRPKPGANLAPGLRPMQDQL